MSFLNLPKEIRLLVYLGLLVSSDPIKLNDCSPLQFEHRQDPGLCPEILRVSKLLYCEVKLILYSNNRFQFPLS